MLAHVLTFTVALIFLSGQSQTNSTVPAPADSSQMSLAERAAAARKAAAEKANHSQTSSAHSVLQVPAPEQRGAVRNNVYVNEFFHLQIDLGQWQVINKAFDPATVLVIQDGAGRLTALTIFRLPQTLPKDLDYWTDLMRKASLSKLSSTQDLTGYKEPVLLGDAGHKFAPFRVAGTLGNLPLVESDQLTICDGYLIDFSVRGRSEDDVSDALRSLKAGMTWTRTAP